MEAPVANLERETENIPTHTMKPNDITVRLVTTDDEAVEQFNDFGPITITLTKPDDLLFLHTAAISYTCGGVEKAKKVLLLMATMASKLSPEEAVEMAITSGREAGYFFPDLR
jgi:hypothetical protein